MELARPRGLEGTRVALEPEQRLHAQSSRPRLERVPHHLRARGIIAPLWRSLRGLPRRLGSEPRVPQRPQLLRDRAAARPRLWWPSFLCPLLVPRPRSERTQRSVCRLLALERRAHPHQPRALHTQPERVQGLRSSLVGPDRFRQLYL